MKSLIVLWADRLSRLNRRRLWIMLAASVGVNLGVAILVLAELPIVPIRPLCVEGSIPSDYDAEVRTIEGKLALPYLEVFGRRFPTRMVRHADYDVTVFVTIAQALDRTDLKKQSGLAVYDLMRQRLGEATYRDWREGRVFVPGFKDKPFRTNCELIRKFAEASGEWSNQGPEPIRTK